MSLALAALEKLWLFIQGATESVYGRNLLRVDVQFEDLGQSYKNQGPWLFIIVAVLKIVFHADLLELGYVFYDDFLEKLKFWSCHAISSLCTGRFHKFEKE